MCRNVSTDPGTIPGDLQGFFRRNRAIFSRPSAGPAYGSGEMHDLYAIGIAAACFAVSFGLLWLLARV